MHVKTEWSTRKGAEVAYRLSEEEFGIAECNIRQGNGRPEIEVR
jgi:hypothetical protein